MPERAGMGMVRWRGRSRERGWVERPGRVAEDGEWEGDEACTQAVGSCVGGGGRWSGGYGEGNAYIQIGEHSRFIGRLLENMKCEFFELQTRVERQLLNDVAE